MQISSCLPIRSSAKLRPQLEQAIKSSRGLGTNRDGGPLAFVFLGAPAAVPLDVLLLLGGFLRNTAGESCEVFPAAALKELRVKGSLLSTGGGLEPFLLTGAGLASLARVSGAARASDFALLEGAGEGATEIGATALFLLGTAGLC